MFNFKSFKVQFCWFITSVAATAVSVTNIAIQTESKTYWIIILALNIIGVYSWFTDMLKHKDFAKLMGKDGSEEA
jgi:hypothetical protein